jgi:hypothetical protein
VVSVVLESVAGLVVEMVLSLVSRMAFGRDVALRMVDGLTWSSLALPFAVLLLLALVAGAWIAFWDD